MSADSGPTSPQANADSVIWNVRLKLISNITNSANAIVTTTTDHGFSNGIYVLLNVPQSYGMWLNNTQTKITVIDATNFSTTINTTSLFPFVAPSYTSTQAQVSPISGLFYNATPGSPSGNPLGS